MNISVSEAKALLAELVRRAEQGEEVVLTRHGQPVAQIGPIRRARLTPAERARVIRDVMKSAAGKASPGPDAAHSQDFLYDENGLPN
ncbi:type II toxin-antitoxin system prevent-host-death family antitoxin [Devosia sp. ZB163]|uniref:type II toxin-antitoxin system Phd/YefM family antitoxin n=1 Tax=Devosia sp. ZB163 TaxID=3025938 RepID=UPI0023609945|nr:type II toxin-antitoxin system prevent-host-death family antitoxin [Devosia sp. ZB163]MDC9824150.1 type II toxin-antitoxin system prevent-host-death family antitoxin [Devosia sp. ZB163]